MNFEIDLQALLTATQQQRNTALDHAAKMEAGLATAQAVIAERDKQIEELSARPDLPLPIFVAGSEGDMWEPFSSRLKVVHSVLFDDGSMFDTLNGWRSFKLTPANIDTIKKMRGGNHSISEGQHA